MKKFWIQVVFLVAVSFGALYLSFKPNSLGWQFLPSYQGGGSTTAANRLKINQTTINIEVADTTALRRQGLSGRDSLDPNSGMLFVFQDTSKHQFWMKGMKIPLDFIFINNGKVVDILTNIKPPVDGQKDETLPIYQPVTAVNMVLEVNAGYVSTHNIKLGDNVFLVGD